MATSLQPPANGAKARLKIQYQHLREADVFLDLSERDLDELPPAMKAKLAMNKGHSPRLRVTLDSKTNQVVAKVIKVRLADYHVFNPGQAFDWRLSVSLEMNWNGNLEQFVARTSQVDKLSKPERRKDRMSYKHCQCQIDLTQVRVGKGPPLHELEVELSAAEVKRQGKLAMAQRDNGYEDLVKSFVDNVRILTRLIK